MLNPFQYESIGYIDHKMLCHVLSKLSQKMENCQHSHIQKFLKIRNPIIYSQEKQSIYQIGILESKSVSK